MTNTITADLHTQVMTCRVCGAQHEIPRKLLRDQHKLMLLVDDVAADHRECAARPEHPHLARLSREFRKRLEREQQRAALRQRNQISARHLRAA